MNRSGWAKTALWIACTGIVGMWATNALAKDPAGTIGIIVVTILGGLVLTILLLVFGVQNLLDRMFPEDMKQELAEEKADALLSVKEKYDAIGPDEPIYSLLERKPALLENHPRLSKAILFGLVGLIGICSLVGTVLFIDNGGVLLLFFLTLDALLIRLLYRILRPSNEQKPANAPSGTFQIFRNRICWHPENKERPIRDMKKITVTTHETRTSKRKVIRIDMGDLSLQFNRQTGAWPADIMDLQENMDQLDGALAYIGLKKTDRKTGFQAISSSSTYEW